MTQAEFIKEVNALKLEFDTILQYVRAHIKGIEKRKEYASSPEAKKKAQARRLREKEELAAFKAWKQSKVN